MGVFKNILNTKSEKGRSMVEMLGVLAIVGVLSIGGIQGYRYAMDRHKANEFMNFINQFYTLAVAQDATRAKMYNEAGYLDDYYNLSDVGLQNPYRRMAIDVEWGSNYWPASDGVPYRAVYVEMSGNENKGLFKALLSSPVKWCSVEDGEGLDMGDYVGSMWYVPPGVASGACN